MKPMTFVAAVNNEQTLQVCLLRSPCFQGEHQHQVILIREATSAAEAYNAGLEQAKHELIVFVHQDVYLPEGWPELLLAKYSEAEIEFGAIGVAGVYGVGGDGYVRYGRIINRGAPLFEPERLPARVRTLDELLLVLPSNTPLRFDPTLGFHFYGADIAMQANAAGMAAVVLEALCHHSSGTVLLPSSFGTSKGIFAEKWRKELPVYTSCCEVRG